MTDLIVKAYKKIMTAGIRGEVLPCGLAGGTAGLALLAISPSIDDISAEEQKDNFLTLTQISSKKIRQNFNFQAGLFSGLSGYMTVLAAGTSVGYISAKHLKACEPLMKTVLARKIENISAIGWNQLFYAYDVVEGLAGDLLALRYIAEEYELSRPLKSTISLAVDTLVEGISMNHREGPNALLLPSFYPSDAPWYNQQAPHGGYVLGYAHGVPGILSGIIAGRQASGENVQSERQTLSDCINWYLELQEEDGNWPNMLPVGGKSAESVSKRTRLAWCYGSPGVLPLLHYASRTLGCEKAMPTIRKALNGVASTKVGAEGDISPTFCHGWTGIAESLSYLSSTLEGVYLDHEKSMYESAIQNRLLSEKNSEFGILDWESPYTRVSKAGLLEGASGVMLYQFSKRNNETNSAFFRILNSFCI